MGKSDNKQKRAKPAKASGAKPAKSSRTKPAKAKPAKPGRAKLTKTGRGKPALTRYRTLVHRDAAVEPPEEVLADPFDAQGAMSPKRTDHLGRGRLPQRFAG